MVDTIILTEPEIRRIKELIEEAKKQICKQEQYILAARNGIEQIKKGILLNEWKLANGVIEHEIVNGIDLNELKLPFYCYFDGVIEKKRRGVVTSTYHGRMEYQLHDCSRHSANHYPTMIYEEFELANLITKWNIRRKEETKNEHSEI